MKSSCPTASWKRHCKLMREWKWKRQITFQYYYENSFNWKNLLEGSQEASEIPGQPFLNHSVNSTGKSPIRVRSWKKLSTKMWEWHLAGEVWEISFGRRLCRDSWWPTKLWQSTYCDVLNVKDTVFIRMTFHLWNIWSWWPSLLDMILDTVTHVPVNSLQWPPLEIISSWVWVKNAEGWFT